MTLKKSPHNIESEACTLTDTLGGEERIEDASLNLVRNSGTIIDDAHDNRVELIRSLR
jgi:hypothetical protein